MVGAFLFCLHFFFLMMKAQCYLSDFSFYLLHMLMLLLIAATTFLDSLDQSGKNNASFVVPGVGLVGSDDSFTASFGVIGSRFFQINNHTPFTNYQSYNLLLPSPKSIVFMIYPLIIIISALQFKPFFTQKSFEDH